MVSWRLLEFAVFGTDNSDVLMDGLVVCFGVVVFVVVDCVGLFDDFIERLDSFEVTLDDAAFGASFSG